MAGWHFVTIPGTEAQDIKERFAIVKRGFGSLPVTAKIGQTSWQTSIFPDKKTGTYLMPIKAIVRQKERIAEDDEVELSIEIRV